MSVGLAFCEIIFLPKCRLEVGFLIYGCIHIIPYKSYFAAHYLSQPGSRSLRGTQQCLLSTIIDGFNYSKHRPATKVLTFVCLAHLTLEMKSVDSNSQEIAFAALPASFIVTALMFGKLRSSGDRIPFPLGLEVLRKRIEEWNFQLCYH